MKIVFEFRDREGNLLNLTKEEQEQAKEKVLDRAMERIGFRRVEKEETKA